MNRGSLSYLFKGGENPPVLHHFPQPYVRKAIYLGAAIESSDPVQVSPIRGHLRECITKVELSDA